MPEKVKVGSARTSKHVLSTSTLMASNEEGTPSQIILTREIFEIRGNANLKLVSSCSLVDANLTIYKHFISKILTVAPGTNFIGIHLEQLPLQLLGKNYTVGFSSEFP